MYHPYKLLSICCQSWIPSRQVLRNSYSPYSRWLCMQPCYTMQCFPLALERFIFIIITSIIITITIIIIGGTIAMHFHTSGFHSLSISTCGGLKVARVCRIFCAIFSALYIFHNMDKYSGCKLSLANDTNTPRNFLIKYGE